MEHIIATLVYQHLGTNDLASIKRLNSYCNNNIDIFMITQIERKRSFKKLAKANRFDLVKRHVDVIIRHRHKCDIYLFQMIVKHRMDDLFGEHYIRGMVERDKFYTEKGYWVKCGDVYSRWMYGKVNDKMSFVEYIAYYGNTRMLARYGDENNVSCMAIYYAAANGHDDTLLMLDELLGENVKPTKFFLDNAFWKTAYHGHHSSLMILVRMFSVVLLCSENKISFDWLVRLFSNKKFETILFLRREFPAMMAHMVDYYVFEKLYFSREYDAVLFLRKNFPTIAELIDHIILRPCDRDFFTIEECGEHITNYLRQGKAPT